MKVSGACCFFISPSYNDVRILLFLWPSIWHCAILKTKITIRREMYHEEDIK